MDRQLCRKIFGTDNEADLREIAEKARKYDRLYQKDYPMNIRQAGRKAKFTDCDIEVMLEMYENKESIGRIAAYFATSRQTVYKYIGNLRQFETNPDVVMRMNYMYRDEVCTVIDVDFLHRKVYVYNRTKDILHRAFGVVKEPTWEQFEDFLESRCFPRSRANLKLILRDLGLEAYEPLAIIEKTKGHMAEDHQWIDIIYKNAEELHKSHKDFLLKEGVHGG